MLLNIICTGMGGEETTEHWKDEWRDGENSRVWARTAGMRFSVFEDHFTDFKKYIQCYWVLTLSKVTAIALARFVWLWFCRVISVNQFFFLILKTAVLISLYISVFKDMCSEIKCLLCFKGSFDTWVILNSCIVRRKVRFQVRFIDMSTLQSEHIVFELKIGGTQCHSAIFISMNVSTSP